LDASAIAAMPVDDFVAVCSAKPAVHRFPGSMGTRVHQLCAYLVERYDGDAAAVWTGVTSGAVLLARVRDLPGFGDEKAKIFVAVLGKRFGVTPRGWKQAAAPFSDSTPRSVADIDSPEALARVRAWKKAQKAAGKSKAE
ncbi:MAG: HhH-GPD-type base excision DNA repair protein, partial [Actinomycetota bacterium]